jgi:hypothetical protein
MGVFQQPASGPNVILNPESVMLNLFQHLFRAALSQHPVYKINELRDPKIVRP